jgi:hypothetical protein
MKHLTLFAGLTLAGLLAVPAPAAERNQVRVLYDFEDPAELEGLRADAEQVTFDLVQDNGVTRGKNCCRMVFAKGAAWGAFHFGKEKLKDWQDFDYIAFDIFSDREEKVAFCFELMDALSKNYHTRCSFESQAIRPGKQTIVIPINRAKRNGKEGRDWEELEPQDKIRMNALTRVKFFLTPPKTEDLVLWVDNIRLMQEDALGLKMKVALPAGAKAFDFGPTGSLVPGFTPVTAEAAFDEAKGFGLSGAKAELIGKHWPDPLTGNGVISASNEPLRVQVKLLDGTYWLWLSAGMRISAEAKDPRFLLKIGEDVLCDERPTPAELHGEKYLYRFLRTPYSERPNALWLDFVAKMYPAIECKVTVTGGKLTIEAANHWLASLIVLPADREQEFRAMAESIQAERLRIFNAVTVLDPQQKPAKVDGDGAYVAFIPDETKGFSPATGPNEAERKRKACDLAAAPGQRLVFRCAVAPFEDLGACRVELSALKGPAEIPATAARIYMQEYRVRGSGVQEAALIPSAEWPLEKGVTRCWWFWMQVPADAPAGEYTGRVSVRPAKGNATEFPVKLTVHPFKLEEVLPVSFGMYYQRPSDAKEVAEQLQFMREVGFTGTVVGSGNVTGVKGDDVQMQFDPTMWKLVREAGMGRHPLQMQMGTSLGCARAIARTGLGLSGKVDSNPGCEFDHPKLKPLYINAMRKFAGFIKEQGLPVAVEIVDEPREVPNPWNRNLAHTCLYGDWLKEAGITHTFVTPMGDVQGGKDYTALVDHADIISTHAGGGSAKLMKLTPEKKKTLWLYNTGMDRLSWGFYNWRVGSVGRWEWHFCWSEGGSNTGYPNADEWYNPFTTGDGYAPHGPSNLPGRMLFKSAFLTCSEGITDTAYLVTLEKALQTATGQAGKAETVKKAQTFLAELKASIPFLPGVKGLEGADSGALVGKGLEGPAGEHCESWRRKIAELLIALQ